MRFISLAFVVVMVGACASDPDPVDCEKSGLAINVEQVVDASSCSTADGRILAAVSGGLEPYSYLINGEVVDGAGEFNNLPAGTYSVGVRDANFCDASVGNVTIVAADFSFATTLLPNTSCLSGTGSATIQVTSSNPPYNFRLGEGSFTSNNTFGGLASGNHTITIQDNSNCTVALTITIPQGTTGTSWAGDIQPIMEKNCAITGCHNGVSRSNNFVQYSSVKSFAKSIKTKTQDKSMPFDGSLTENQIALIACWVDDGALQN